MSRCTLRNIFTVLIYAGVAIFLYPYVTGHFSSAIFYLVAGIGLAVVCGILRCVCIEGDCTDREATAHALERSSNVGGSHPKAHS